MFAVGSDDDTKFIEVGVARIGNDIVGPEREIGRFGFRQVELANHVVGGFVDMRPDHYHIAVVAVDSHRPVDDIAVNNRSPRAVDSDRSCHSRICVRFSERQFRGIADRLGGSGEAAAYSALGFSEDGIALELLELSGLYCLIGVGWLGHGCDQNLLVAD